MPCGVADLESEVMLSRLASLRPLAQIAARPSIAARCLSSQAGAVSQGTVKAFDARRVRDERS